MASFVSGGVPIRIDQQEPTAVGRHPAILLLHGSGGNVSFWFERIAPQLARLNLGLYAVHYFDRTGTVSADRETILDGYHFPTWQSTALDAIAYIRTRPSINPDRIALLGTSLGAFLALSLATDRTARIRAVVEISGGIPEPAIPAVGVEFPPTLILHGDADTVVPVSMAHQLKDLLARKGVAHQSLILPGQGHWFGPGAQLQILMATAGFLARHL
ncbi:MAG TPA: alpha/beta fold hydrolase [Acidobacteriaceae bacterium]|jgi:pimeloyl-ACP methyl ester carboxylesterase|nr:alpha/beta fold hydrolase [Acidobacteriaceae bacterium]